MKKALIAIFSFLVLFSLNAHSIEISRHLSGSWYNPDQDGHGLSVEILADHRAVFYWYVYNPDGSPTFLLAIGETEGNSIVAQAYHVTGMQWGIFDPSGKILTYWGDIVLTFQDCNRANLNYLAAHDDTSIPHGGGDIPLVRLANIELLQCNDNPYSGIYEGLVERDASGIRHRAKILVDANNEFTVFVEDSFMAFGSFGETSLDLMTSENALIYPLDSQSGSIQVPHFNATVDLGNRLQLSYYTLGPYGLGSGDLVSLEMAFRRGVELSGPGRLNSIERRYSLQDLNSDLHAQAEIGHDGTFVATSVLSACTWNGNVTIPNPMFNLLDVSFDVTNCGDRDGRYTGLGYYADGHEYFIDRVLYIYASSDTNPMALVLVRTS